MNDLKLALAVFSFITLMAVGFAPIAAHAGAPVGASVEAREFGPYVGGALTKNFATVQQPNVNATLSGWGNSVELGFDLPLTDSIGFSIAGEIGQRELRNTTTSNTYLDDTTMNTRAARGALFFKSVHLGGSYQTAGIDMKSMSTTSGASSLHLDATGSSVFAGYDINYKNLLRATVEGESTRFSANGFTYTDTSIGLRLQLLFAGFFDH